MIADWANDRQLSVPVDKCSVLETGRGKAVVAEFTVGAVETQITVRRMAGWLE